MGTQASFTRGSDEYHSTVCLPCHRDKTTVPAYGYCIDCKEHLCHACYTYHKKATPSMHHKLQDQATMPSTQHLTNTAVHHPNTNNLTTPCENHQKEMIKLFCHNHEVFLCSICVSLEHRPCHVDYIPDISKQIIDSREYKHTINRIDKLIKKCETTEKEKSENAKKTNDSLKNALQDITKYRHDINKQLDDLQRELEDTIQAIKHQTNEQIKTAETLCGDIVKTIKLKLDSMKQLNTSKQADLLFIEAKQAQKQLQEYEESIASVSTNNCMDEYKFIPWQAITDVLHKEKSIGDISSKHQVQAGSSTQRNILRPSAVNDGPQKEKIVGNIPKTKRSTAGAASQSSLLPSVDDTITPTCPSEICVKSSQDEERCWITGMTVLPPDRLVLTDWKNKSIKLVEVNSKSIISHLSLDTDTPWDITTTTSTQVAVTVPFRQYIQFISVSNKLSKSHTIQTDGLCEGICCHQDKLVVTYRNPEKLEILDMKGRVITTVDTDSTGEDVFRWPEYVQANSSSIYVSDVPLNAVIMLNWSGEITGRITDIEDPRGIALLGDGRLLVCDVGYGRVYQVSGSTSSRIVLQDVRYPYAVCVDDRRHKLYISRAASDNKLDNNILVYNI